MTPTRLAGIALLAALVSCGDAIAPRPPITELARARQQWEAQQLRTYAFTLQRSCFCGNTDPLYVYVRNDTVAGVVDLRTGESVDRQLGETVDGLFDFIQRATDAHARIIRATYDATRGFPAEIDYDGDAQIADDELFYRVSDVHTVPPVE